MNINDMTHQNFADDINFIDNNLYELLYLIDKNDEIIVVQ